MNDADAAALNEAAPSFRTVTLMTLMRVLPSHDVSSSGTVEGSSARPHLQVEGRLSGARVQCHWLKRTGAKMVAAARNVLD